MLPSALADDFEAFLRRQSATVSATVNAPAVGDAEPQRFAPGADIRRDAPPLPRIR